MSGMLLPKHKRYENTDYTDWVKVQPCVITGMPADDPHHAVGLGLGGGWNCKAPDWATMPMTREAHSRFHSVMAKDRHYLQMQWGWMYITLCQAYLAGWFQYELPENLKQNLLECRAPLNWKDEVMEFGRIIENQ